jgi:hypothetical protein
MGMLAELEKDDLFGCHIQGWKKPGFFLKNPAQWVFLGFFGFFGFFGCLGFFWVFLPRRECAAKAFCYCPAIISHRPGSQNTSKEPQLNPEKDSRIKRARSHVTLEKSS